MSEVTPSKRSRGRRDNNVYYLNMNEQKVEDITLEFFYRPHTLSLLAIIMSWLLYVACTRSNSNPSENIFYGMATVLGIVVLPISILLFPNGPFTRPHPALWRIVFGASLCYFLLLVFMVFCNMDQVRSAMIFIDPSLKDAKREIDVVETYAANCSDVSLKTLYDALDIFAFAHFWGWGMKALMIRNYGICWTISVTWELTEFQFEHVLPNFKECWWDHWILDVLLCNGGGIWLGMQVAKFLEIRRYRWESVLSIDSKSGKAKRCLLQFTPASWSNINWLERTKPFGRMCALFVLMMLWQMVELNTFFAKHFFRYPGHNWLCWGRILFLGLGSMPAIKQYYTYATDPRCKRLGNHAWLFVAICTTETIMNIKFGLESNELSEANLVYIVQWIVIMFFGAFVGLNLNYIAGYNSFSKTGYPQAEEDSLHKGDSSKKIKAN